MSKQIRGGTQQTENTVVDFRSSYDPVCHSPLSSLVSPSFAFSATAKQTDTQVN